MASVPPPPPPPGYGPPAGYGPPPGSYYGPMRSTNGKAIASLVLAIASIVTCITPLAIVSVILAPLAKREIDSSPQTQDGRGLAEAGHIIGWIVCGLMILGVIAFVVGMVISAAVDSSSTDSLSMAVG